MSTRTNVTKNLNGPERNLFKLVKLLLFDFELKFLLFLIRIILFFYTIYYCFSFIFAHFVKLYKLLRYPGQYYYPYSYPYPYLQFVIVIVIIIGFAVINFPIDDINSPVDSIVVHLVFLLTNFLAHWQLLVICHWTTNTKLFSLLFHVFVLFSIFSALFFNLTDFSFFKLSIIISYLFLIFIIVFLFFL